MEMTNVIFNCKVLRLYLPAILNMSWWSFLEVGYSKSPILLYQSLIVDLFSALEIRILNGRYIEAALAPLWLEAKVIPYN